MINGQPTEFKENTVADFTVVPLSVYYSLKPTPVLNKTSRLLMGPSKQTLSCLGSFIAELQVKDTVAKERVYVIEDLERPLVGKEPDEHLKLISRLDSLSSRNLDKRRFSRDKVSSSGT